MRLSEGIKDRQYKIVRFIGGRGMRRRLLSMGLTVGVVVEAVIINPYGPVLIEVRGTRLAVGHGLAEKIEIMEIK